jgi:hypothetical protein
MGDRRQATGMSSTVRNENCALNLLREDDVTREGYHSLVVYTSGDCVRAIDDCPGNTASTTKWRQMSFGCLPLNCDTCKAPHPLVYDAGDLP